MTCIAIKEFSCHNEGLISTDWGGTPVEAWSSPDALKTCGVLSQEQAPK